MSSFTSSITSFFNKSNDSSHDINSQNKRSNTDVPLPILKREESSPLPFDFGISSSIRTKSSIYNSSNSNNNSNTSTNNTTLINTNNSNILPSFTKNITNLFNNNSNNTNPNINLEETDLPLPTSGNNNVSIWDYIITSAPDQLLKYINIMSDRDNDLENENKEIKFDDLTLKILDQRVEQSVRFTFEVPVFGIYGYIIFKIYYRRPWL